jgi:Rrf2 family protein
MFQVSKKSQYGLRAMVYVARASRKKEISSLKKISEAEGIPFDFLEKIVSQLEKAGLVKSKKGVQGGYFLAKSPKKISAVEIMEALEGKIAPVGCALCGKSRRCLSKNVWDKVRASLVSTLKSISLSELIRK